ncbi:N-acetylglucosaminyl-phosphatidylinositol de-N-acetylase [Spatholobus suberectus]|nr:N-acetylglucosaminyl-phosphatidylinositol de-N-acetylase [Spatholobus suberectus]
MDRFSLQSSPSLSHPFRQTFYAKRYASFFISPQFLLLLVVPPQFARFSGRAFRKRNVLLVIAHPDDESMFFTPTINFLTSKGHNVHILCLSIGD